MSTSAVRRARLYPPVAVRAEVITKPICACRLLPTGSAGCISIIADGKVKQYGLSYIADRNARTDEVRIVGYRLLTGEGKVYDLPDSLDACDCGDSTFRVREGGCRHQVALRDLRERGEIA